jgi:hypothetical protein
MKQRSEIPGKGYDLVGDIHGHVDQLSRLLVRLGYRKRNGCYRHTSRQVIFLGDFIDRGPQIRETLKIVRSMIDEGEALAVMGNHEYNAIRYHTKGPRGFLRKHTLRNSRQHRATLRAFDGRKIEWNDYLQWFRRLPLFLDLSGLRAVHACWCDESIRALDGSAVLTDEILAGDSQVATTRRSAAEMLLRGKEISLPDGRTFIDKDGIPQSTIRVRWWLPGTSRTYRDLAIPGSDTLPNQCIGTEIEAKLPGYPQTASPVMIGHYWLTPAKPQPLAPNVACLDYSVAAGGPLVAYRWQGEHVLARSSFIASSARKESYPHGFRN